MQTIPGYHLKTTLGEGGMASAYLATQKSLDRPVAIKALDARLNRDELIQAQFAQESKIIAQLNHPNIVQVIDQGTTDQGLPYFVMPYVKGISPDSILQRDDMSMTRKLDILIQICAALAYAHRNGVIHRDIKPDNLLVDYDGHVRLVDFGIAGYFTANKEKPKPSLEQLVMGTGAYMAPEQQQGTINTSHLNNIYPLGILIHEVIYGVQPLMATQASHKPLESNKYNLAARLRPLVLQCIDVDPQSVEDIRQSLLLIAQGRHLRNNRWGMESTRDNIPPNYNLLDVLKENPFGAIHQPTCNPPYQLPLRYSRLILDGLFYESNNAVIGVNPIKNSQPSSPISTRSGQDNSSARNPTPELCAYQCETRSPCIMS